MSNSSRRLATSHSKRSRSALISFIFSRNQKFSLAISSINWLGLPLLLLLLTTVAGAMIEPTVGPLTVATNGTAIADTVADAGGDATIVFRQCIGFVDDVTAVSMLRFTLYVFCYAILWTTINSRRCENFADFIHEIVAFCCFSNGIACPAAAAAAAGQCSWLYKCHSCSSLNFTIAHTLFLWEFWPIHSICHSKNTFSLDSIGLELVWNWNWIAFAFALVCSAYFSRYFSYCYRLLLVFLFNFVFFFLLSFALGLFVRLCRSSVFSCYVDRFKSVQFSLVRSRFSKDIKIYALSLAKARQNPNINYSNWISSNNNCFFLKVSEQFIGFSLFSFDSSLFTIILFVRFCVRCLCIRCALRCLHLYL